MDKVGKDGVITVEEGKSLDTYVDLVEGMQFDKGYLSPHFVTDTGRAWSPSSRTPTSSSTRRRSRTPRTCPLLEKVAKSGRPLLIIAEDVEAKPWPRSSSTACAASLKVCAVKAPGFGDRRKAMLEDIAVLTGGTAIMEDLGINLENARLTGDLGKAKKRRHRQGRHDDHRRRRQEEATSRAASRARSAPRSTAPVRLRQGEAAGAPGQAGRRRRADQRRRGDRVEMKEKKARVEDAMHACRAEQIAAERRHTTAASSG